METLEELQILSAQMQEESNVWMSRRNANEVLLCKSHIRDIASVHKGRHCGQNRPKINFLAHIKSAQCGRKLTLHITLKDGSNGIMLWECMFSAGNNSKERYKNPPVPLYTFTWRLKRKKKKNYICGRSLVLQIKGLDFFFFSLKPRLSSIQQLTACHGLW